MSFNEILFYADIITMVLMSIIAIGVYMNDKKRAVKGAMRIKEKTLLFFAITNGALGALFGRKIAHHKTDKVYFSITIYFSLFLQILVLAFLGYLAFIG